MTKQRIPPYNYLGPCFFLWTIRTFADRWPDRAATSSNGSNSTVNDDFWGNQLSNLPPDKCNLFLSSNRAIIKQKNFSSEGVQGRLKTCLRFWHETLQCPQFVYNVIERGYVLPLKATPPPVFIRNNRSALDHPEFVEQSIGNQLLKLMMY